MIAPEITIPLLPCRSLNDILEFYGALGFEVIYHQVKPNTYAAVKRGGIELHFFVMRSYDPAQSYSTCYVRTEAVDDLYAAFTSGLRSKYGKLPTVGIPRISALKNKSYGVREFIVVDPGGNYIRIGQSLESLNIATEAPQDALARAVEAAIALGDSKGDFQGATKVLDTALAKSEGSAVSRVRALVARAGFALELGEVEKAHVALAELKVINLSEAEQALLQVELERAQDIESNL